MLAQKNGERVKGDLAPDGFGMGRCRGVLAQKNGERVKAHSRVVVGSLGFIMGARGRWKKEIV